MDSANVIPSIAALVSVLPELVAESDPREALKQVPLFLHLYVYALVKKKMILGLFYKANCVFTLLERWAASSLVLPSWEGSPSFEQIIVGQESIVQTVKKMLLSLKKLRQNKLRA